MVVDEAEVNAVIDRWARVRDARSARDFAANVLARAVSVGDDAEVIALLVDDWRAADDAMTVALDVALSEAHAGGDQ